MLAAVAAAGPLAHSARAHSARAQAKDPGKDPTDIYNIGKSSNVMLLHITDTHGQLLPVRCREPSVNIGIGAAAGQPPHVVSRALLCHFGIAPGTALRTRSVSSTSPRPPRISAAWAATPISAR
jgi:sulfur-oxidizing protein SoxB